MESSVNLQRVAKGLVRAFRAPEIPYWYLGTREPSYMPAARANWGPPLTDWQENALLYDADTIIAELLRGSPDGKNYHIGGMYIEFDNSGIDVNPVPTIGRGGNLAGYYNGLNSGDPNRDYLRVPLIGTQIASSNTGNWPLGNQPEFFSQSAGTVGVHGNTYSDVANSRVYGAALVAFKDVGDAAQDLVFARFYFAPGSQVAKVAGSQIGIDWKYTFT